MFVFVFTLNVERKVIEFEFLEERALYALDHVHLEVPLLFDVVVVFADAILDVFFFHIPNGVVDVELWVPEQLAIYMIRAVRVIVLVELGQLLRPRDEQRCLARELLVYCVYLYCLEFEAKSLFFFFILMIFQFYLSRRCE